MIPVPAPSAEADKPVHTRDPFHPKYAHPFAATHCPPMPNPLSRLACSLSTVPSKRMFTLAFRSLLSCAVAAPPGVCQELRGAWWTNGRLFSQGGNHPLFRRGELRQERIAYNFECTGTTAPWGYGNTLFELQPVLVDSATSLPHRAFMAPALATHFRPV